MVGDFNARVGRTEREDSEETWNGVKGVHGVGRMNEAGADLLSFCALNELTIMNTCFQKKDIHKFTWQHLGSKQWHCIDYVIMRQWQRRLCRDVGVIQSADCWTDHKLLRAKISIKVPAKPSTSKIRPRFAVSSLRDPKVRERYSNVVLREVTQDWRQEASGERKWSVIKEGLNKAAEVVLGQEKRQSPDWFQDNIHTLETLITKRNDLFSRWLRTRSPTDKQRYATRRREVAHEIRRCKNVRFKKKAREVEAVVRKSRGAWKGLRELQQGRAGLRPVRPYAIKDLDGNLCVGHDNTLQWWHQHFNCVLNVHSSYDVHVVDAVEEYPTRSELADPPTAEEVVEAMGKLKEGKAEGKNGILPEMVRGCGETMMDYTLDMFRTYEWSRECPRSGEMLCMCQILKKVTSHSVITGGESAYWM